VHFVGVFLIPRRVRQFWHKDRDIQRHKKSERPD
jgi:hypothetical protein